MWGVPEAKKDKARTAEWLTCGTRKGESAVGNEGEKHGEHDQGTNEQGDDRDNKSSR